MGSMEGLGLVALTACRRSPEKPMSSGTGTPQSQISYSNHPWGPMESEGWAHVNRGFVGVDVAADERHELSSIHVDTATPKVLRLHQSSICAWEGNHDCNHPWGPWKIWVWWRSPPAGKAREAHTPRYRHTAVTQRSH